MHLIGRGYQVRHERVEAGFATHAVFTCGCGRELPIRLHDGITHNPENLAKRARSEGWDAAAYGSRKTVCPDCQKRKPNDVNSALRKIKLPPAAIEESNVVAITATPAAPAAEPRALTPDQKARLRGLLDKHFDDASGCYIDGQSDQRIADTLAMPWKLVADYRELAYGPLREDPTVSEVKAALAKLQAEVDTKATEFAQWREGVRKRVDDLVARLNQHDRVKKAG